MLSFCPTSRFSSVDLPTLGRPTRATVPARCPAVSCISGPPPARRRDAQRSAPQRAGSNPLPACGCRGPGRRIPPGIAVHALRPSRSRRCTGARPSRRPCRCSCSRVLASLPGVPVSSSSSSGSVDSAYDLARTIESAVEEDGAQYRLQAIGQDRGPPKTAALELSLAQPQLPAQIHRRGDAAERLLVHQVGAQSGQIALWRGAGNVRTAAMRRCN